MLALLQASPVLPACVVYPCLGALPACRDVVTDTVHQFAPAYHDYVLYSDGTHKAATPPKTVRTRTFMAVGQESTRGAHGDNLLMNM